MRPFIAVMLCSSLALADPATDAPLKQGDHVCGTRETDLDAHGCTVELKPGELAPYAATALDEQENVRRTRDRARKAGTLENAEEKNVLLPKGALAAIIAGCIVLAAAAGAAVTYVAIPKPAPSP